MSDLLKLVFFDFEVVRGDRPQPGFTAVLAAATLLLPLGLTARWWRPGPFADAAAHCSRRSGGNSGKSSQFGNPPISRDRWNQTRSIDVIMIDGSRRLQNEQIHSRERTMEMRDVPHGPPPTHSHATAIHTPMLQPFALHVTSVLHVLVAGLWLPKSSFVYVCNDKEINKSRKGQL